MKSADEYGECGCFHAWKLNFVCDQVQLNGISFRTLVVATVVQPSII